MPILTLIFNGFASFKQPFGAYFSTFSRLTLPLSDSELYLTLEEMYLPIHVILSNHATALSYGLRLQEFHLLSSPAPGQFAKVP